MQEQSQQVEQQQLIEKLKDRLAVLQGQSQEKDAPAEPIDPALAERRAKFTGAQRRLAHVLSWGGKYSNLIDSGRTDASVLSDKLVTMQIVRLMLDSDGSDGIMYAVTGWNSKRDHTLAERIGNHTSLYECDPHWRLGMQSPERQEAYRRREAQALKLPYSEPRPPLKLEANTLVRMTAEEFAAFVIEFHRQVLHWDLKAYTYANLHTPAPEFFDGFVRLQREADKAEEGLFNDAMAAHMLATGPDLGEAEAQSFLAMLASMGERQRLEEKRRAERIAQQRPRTEPNPPTTTEPAPAAAEHPWDDIDVAAVERYYDLQIEAIEQERLATEQAGQERTTGNQIPSGS